MAPPTDTDVARHLQAVRATWGGLWPHITTDLRAALLDAQVLAATAERPFLVDRRWIDIFRARMHAHVSVPMGDWPTP